MDANSALRPYLEDKLVRVGLAILAIGVGPLLLIILASAIGLLSDPNPNPVGPGMLAALCFWPGVICTVVGIARVRRGQTR